MAILISMMNLQRFIDSKQEELRTLREAMPEALVFSRPDFLSALRAPCPTGQPLRVIAEFKRSSPSEGGINDSLSPRQAAQQYAAGGATCMSVLTERRYFRGSTEDLSAAQSGGLPLLRKDFIFDELQVRETYATPASALLLIVALTPDADKLRSLRELAEEQGIQAVVEVFNEEELKLARVSGARIIQVNARNLETFATDRAECLRLVRLRHAGEVWIAASAMSERDHLLDAASAGYDAALVGTALMKSPNPMLKLQQLLHE